MSKIFKYIALAEGSSYLILFFNMLFIKHSYPELYKILLFPFGMAHGLLFVSYVLLAFSIKKQQDWTIKELAVVQIASLLPFATFYIEKKYMKNA
ncbi:MAG: hypothetical protein RL427_1817 [Bacteroidota bacterium]|jgi:integral membrane protein